MKFKPLPLILILVLSFTVLGSLTPQVSAYNDYLTDGANWAYFPLQLRTCYFEDGFWGNSSSALAIHFTSTTNKIAFYNINPDDPNAIVAPYAEVDTSLTGPYSGLYQYNSTSVLLAVRTTTALLNWTVVSDTTSQYPYSTSINAQGTPSYMSNIVKVGSDYYTVIKFVDSTPANTKVQICCSDNSVTLISPNDQLLGNAYGVTFLQTGADLGSTNSANIIFCWFNSMTASGLSGDNKTRTYTFNTATDTLTAHGSIGTWITLVNSIKSWNWIAGLATDRESDTDVNLITNYLGSDGKNNLVINQLAYGTGSVETAGVINFTGGEGTGFLPCGYWEAYSDRVLSDQNTGEELSDLYISTWAGIPEGPYITAGLNVGALGPVYNSTNFLFGYQHGSEFRIEVDSSNNLRVYTIWGELPAGEENPSLLNPANVIGKDNPTNLNYTLTTGTHFYFDDLENLSPAYITNATLGIIGNATDVTSYKVAIGIYTASNQAPITSSNPLKLVWSKTWTLSGSAPVYLQLSDNPLLSIPTNSYGAIAYSSSCDILVNQTYTAETLYNTTGFLPNTLSNFQVEGVKGIYLFMSYGTIYVPVNQTTIVPTLNPDEDTYIIPRIQQLGYYFGIGPSFFGILIWLGSLIGICLFLALVSRNSIPSFVYGILTVGITIGFSSVGLLPIWFGALMIIGIIGLGAVTIARTTGGE